VWLSEGERDIHRKKKKKKRKRDGEKRFLSYLKQGIP
jgi:hypothetical protein